MRSQQQCRLIEHLEGMSSEAVGVRQASAFVVEGEPDEHQLHRIASLPFETQDEWVAVLGRIAPVEELALQEYKKEMGLVERLKYELGIGQIGSAKYDTYKRMRESYSRKLASKRGLRILIALRRYRKEHHRWPDSLDEIRQRVSAEILVDPSNKGAFVYRLTDDGFTLYSKGENDLDEDGEYKGGRRRDGPDDWLIWPPRGRKTQAGTANRK